MARNITQEALDEMTPFARELTLWGWRDNFPPILTQVALAHKLGVKRATVNSWFAPRMRSVPRGHAWYQVLRATGWPVEKLLQLTGYKEPPPEELTVWEFLHAQLETPDPNGGLTDAGQRAKVDGWLTHMESLYEATVKPQPRPTWSARQQERSQEKRQEKRQEKQQAERLQHMTPGWPEGTTTTLPSAPATPKRREKVTNGK